MATILKVCSKRAHMGPSRQRQLTDRTNHSTSSMKLSFNAGLKLERVETQTQKEERKRKQTPKAVEIQLNSPDEVKVALVALDKMQLIKNSKDYTSKKVEFDNHKNQILSEMGVTSSKYLTSDQRQVYRDAMQPYAFDYWEISVHVKVDDKATVRSKSFRTLVNQVDAVVNKINGDWSKDADLYKIVSRNDSKTATAVNDVQAAVASV